MSDVSVDIIKNRSGEAPDLPSGANLSGVSTAATLQVTNLNPTHINASGVTTATTFSGSLKSTGTPTLGLGVTINSSGINISGVATAGIVSATTLYGDGSNLTGVAMSIAPISYNPDVNDSTVPRASGIGITFTRRIKAGSGNVTLRIAGAAGTVVENFGVGSSVTINNNTVSIDPTSDLDYGDTYYISYPSGAFTNTAGDLDYVGTAYTFGVLGYTGTIWTWGRNEVGQLGLNSIATQYSSPVQLPGTSNWSFVHGMNKSTRGIKVDGTLWTWGYNDKGELGQNNRTNYSSPVQIPGTTWNDITGVDSLVLATKTDGTMWTWGRDSQGSLAQNDDGVARSSPVQIPGTSWSKVICNGAIRTDGTLWLWGFNGYGQLGQNTAGPGGGVATSVSSPVQLGSATNWANAHSGANNNNFAVNTDGELWVWGRNIYGQLGLNTPSGDNVGRSSPTQVPGTTWSSGDGKLAAGLFGGAAAIKTDGTLWTWGYNKDGMLGLNQGTGGGDYSRSSPTQVGTGTDWDTITSSLYGYIANKTDGTLWAWGGNGNGRLAQNTPGNTNYSSPTQIPGTNWQGRTESDRYDNRHSIWIKNV